MNKQIALAAAVASTVALIAVRPAVAQVAGFSDVPSNHPAAASIAALAKAGIVNGYSSAPLAVGAPDKTKGKKPAVDGNKPVTRYELAVTLYRFVQHLQNAEKLKKSTMGVMAEPKSGAEAVKLLVANGYLSKTSKFVVNSAKGGQKSVTANEFADALGVVITKMRENSSPISKGSLNDIDKPETHTH